MTPTFRETVCRACEWYRQGLKYGACLRLKDYTGRVSIERLAGVVEGKEKCPEGRHEAAALLERIK